jgi:penicillin-binding protein 1A
MQARYGADLYRSGMRVATALDPVMQRAAVLAMASGLAAVDRRFGYRGPDAKVDGAGRAKLVAELKKEQAVLRPGAALRGIVTAVSRDKAVVDVGIAKGAIALADLKWAKPVVERGRSKPPREASDVLAVGDVVRVRVENLGAAEIRLALEQVPEIEGAFVAIDPATREVVAMVGGQNWEASKFNRALQAKRQPGSAFKPILYAAAIVGKKLTLADMVVSAPYQFGVPGTTDFWSVKNYDGQSRGAIPVREALARSDNSVSARIMERIGVEPVLDMARRLGVKSELPRYRSIALGAGEVTPLELTNAFATFAAGGVRAEPSLLRTKEAVAAEQVLSPAEAFVMTSLLRAPVEHPAGTAGRLRALGTAVAGKTGTTSEHRDIWFVGYTRDLVAGVWVGYDDHRKIGGRATGGHDAIPIWHAFMKKVYEVRPKRDFGAPSNIEFVNVVPGEGKRAPVGFPGAVREPFIPGTAPAEVAAMPGEITRATLERDETFAP